jgi:hypothetical protein
MSRPADGHIEVEPTPTRVVEDEDRAEVNRELQVAGAPSDASETIRSDAPADTSRIPDQLRASPPPEYEAAVGRPTDEGDWDVDVNPALRRSAEAVGAALLKTADADAADSGREQPSRQQHEATEEPHERQHETPTPEALPPTDTGRGAGDPPPPPETPPPRPAEDPDEGRSRINESEPAEDTGEPDSHAQPNEPVPQQQPPVQTFIPPEGILPPGALVAKLDKTEESSESSGVETQTSDPAAEHLVGLEFPGSSFDFAFVRPGEQGSSAETIAQHSDYLAIQSGIELSGVSKPEKTVVLEVPENHANHYLIAWQERARNDLYDAHHTGRHDEGVAPLAEALARAKGSADRQRIRTFADQIDQFAAEHTTGRLGVVVDADLAADLRDYYGTWSRAARFTSSRTPDTPTEKLQSREPALSQAARHIIVENTPLPQPLLNRLVLETAFDAFDVRDTAIPELTPANRLTDDQVTEALALVEIAKHTVYHEPRTWLSKRKIVQEKHMRDALRQVVKRYNT